MLATITLVLLGSAAVMAAVILFSPVEARISFRFNTPETSGKLLFSFLHSSIFAVLFQMPSQRFAIRIFGRVFGKRSKPVAPVKDVLDDAFLQSSAPAEVPPQGQALLSSVVDAVPGGPVESPSVSTGYPENDMTCISPQQLYEADNLEKKVPETIEVDTEPAQKKVPNQSPASENHEKIAKKSTEKDNWFDRLKSSQALFFLRQHRWYKKIVRALLRMVGSLFTLLRIDRFTLDIKAGMNDPVLVGTLAGLCTAAQHALVPGKKHVLRFEPVFMQSTFAAAGSIRIGTSIGTLVKPLVVLLVSLPYAHTVIIFFRYRRFLKARKAAAIPV